MTARGKTSAKPTSRRFWPSSFPPCRQDIINLFHFLNWLMWLPAELEDQFWTELQSYKQERKMPYVSPFERRAEERGRHRGLLEGIELGLELKFGEAGLRLLPEIRQLTDVAVLEAILAHIKTASTPSDIQQVYQPDPSAPNP